MGEKFYALTPETSQKLLSAGLTAAQWRLWCYLVNLDPFGDRYQDLPDTLAITETLDMSQSTFYAAIAKFKELGLFDFQDKGFSFRSLAHRPAEARKLKTPKNRSEIPKNRSEIPKNRSESRNFGANPEISEEQPPEPVPSKDSSASQTIQTYTDFIQTLSDSERADFKDFCRRETDNYPRPIINLGDYLASKDSNGQPRYLDFWERFRAGAAPRTGAADGEQAWKEALGYAARYNRYDEATWLKSLPISPEMKGAIGACGGLMRIGEANSSELFALKSAFKQALCQPTQPTQPINHQERAYAVPAMR